jgi:hypothetical protein
VLGYPCACFALCWVSSRVFCACLCGRCCAVPVGVCRCCALGVCAGCRCGCLCACGAPWCAVCVLCGRFCPVLLWVSALVCCACSAGVCFVNKNKGLQRFLNEKDYMRFYLPINFFIISIMCPPLFDYIDNIMSIISVLFNFKKTPPSKSFGSSFLVRSNYGNLSR